MEYIPSNAEDAAMHKKFHGMNVGGVDFTKSTVERLRHHQVWSGGDGSFIAVIGRKDALALRKKTSEVLKIVNTELAAVPIEEEELWSQTSRSEKSETVDRFKTYLYIRGQKCIGLCLAERIWEAYRVLSQDTSAVKDDAAAPVQCVLDDSESSSISISAEASAVMLGISRIWTSNQHRKQGIATKLLDCARNSFLYGLTVDKGKVAFSQPTESGGKLARKWFGCQAGWHVYVD
jgi:N-acetyltransferase